jgi:hypothetical protein
MNRRNEKHARKKDGRGRATSFARALAAAWKGVGGEVGFERGRSASGELKPQWACPHRHADNRDETHMQISFARQIPIHNIHSPLIKLYIHAMLLCCCIHPIDVHVRYRYKYKWV